MMAKIVHGASFIGALSYVNDKRKGAKLIAQSNGVCTVNTASIVDSMLMQARMSRRTTKPVSHLILAFSPHDASRLTEEKMARIVHDYMKRMGYDDCQYVAFIHKDRRHPHVHIIANRVNSLGMCIKDSNERYRSTKICKEMTKEYGLYYSLGKESVNEKRLRNMDAVKYHMYHAVRESLMISRNWKEFRDDLRKAGITISFRYNKYTRGIEGISFTMDKSRISSKMRHDVSFSGKQLDNSLTFANLCYSLGNPYATFHEQARDMYEDCREDWRESHTPYECRNIDKLFPDFDGKFRVESSLASLAAPVKTGFNFSTVDSGIEQIIETANNVAALNNECVSVGMDVLQEIIFQPYVPVVSSSGGGGSQSKGGWGDDDKYKKKKRNNATVTQSRGFHR